jgi:integrase
VRATLVRRFPPTHFGTLACCFAEAKAPWCARACGPRCRRRCAAAACNPADAGDEAQATKSYVPMTAGAARRSTTSGRLQETARKRSRYGHRDATMILIAYRHGLRASEVCGLRWDQIDLNSGRASRHA